MSVTTETVSRQSPPTELTSGKLSDMMVLAIRIVALIAGVGVGLLGDGFQWGWTVIVTATAYVALVAAASIAVEDIRQAKDRVATAIMTMAFLLVLFPLVSVAWTVVSEGVSRFDVEMFSDTMRLTLEDLVAQNQGARVGGAFHAIVGTLIVTVIASVLSIPFGLFTAIYLVEYGGKGTLARLITNMIDVMTGIPSIVTGLFAYALFELFLGPGTRSGLAGAVALTVLMTPVVVRSSEEMLRLVPNELREAAYALGVPKWKTIVKVVIPTAIAGILTGITLAIARVVGETAPLLVTAGIAQSANWNPFAGRMTTLPVFVYNSYKYPTLPPEASQARAWSAALILALIVGILFSAARVMASILKPKGLK